MVEVPRTILWHHPPEPLEKGAAQAKPYWSIKSRAAHQPPVEESLLED
jgi:hypothetical protein